MDVGNIIKHKRKALGLTQVELSQRSGINQGQISRFESGESVNITLENLRGLAHALGCNVVDLLPNEDKSQKSTDSSPEPVA